MRNRLLVLLLLLQGAFFFVIPSFGSSVFLSPDETANAVSARQFAAKGDMRLEEPLLAQFPWLHPRSYVTQGTAMVPVGFLGMPILLGIFWKLFGEWGLVLLTPLLALSIAYPLWRFTAKWGRASQVATILAWLSFPTVILYANRGLFANLPVVCLTVWACYLIWEKRSLPRGISAGLCAGFAIAMRPTEIVWMLPWVFLAFIKPRRTPPTSSCEEEGLFKSLSFQEGAGGVLAFAIPLLLAAFVAWKTYGSPFAVGYFLRDPIVKDAAISAPSTVVASPQQIIWPFGIHPMNVLRNTWFYLVKMFWPWTLALLAAVIAFWKNRGARPHILVGAWTLVALVAIYGQAMYQDHVGVNVVSFGNSFLRYLLPMSVLVAFSAGALATKLPKVATAVLAVALVAMGTNLAMRGSDESVLPARRELLKYMAQRIDAKRTFPSDTIFISARSDKVYVPDFLAVSPVPSADLVERLRAAHPHVVVLP